MLELQTLSASRRDRSRRRWREARVAARAMVEAMRRIGETLERHDWERYDRRV